MSEMTAEAVLRAVRDQMVKFVHLQFTDVVGVVKGITIPSHELDTALTTGVWFDGSSIQGFARIAESDMYLMPDPGTYCVIPWESDGDYATARMICDVYTPDGDPFLGDPRGVLKRALEEAKDMGLEYNTGPELEFFLFQYDDCGNPTLSPHDLGGYFDYSTDLAVSVRKQMIFALEAFGIVVEAGARPWN